MFNSARLKLTAWYLLILMSVSIFFSVAFYQVSTREIQQLIRRIEYDEQNIEGILFKRPHLPPHILTLDELNQIKGKLWIRLMMINIFILVVAGGASFFLAGKTLQPIKQILDEQNQFITDASHELRTPLAILRAEMEASLLEKRISDAQARALITSNLEELSSLQELSNRLLQLAQIPSSREDIQRERISLIDVITRAQKKIMPLARKKKIKINNTFDNKKIYINGNENELIEVFVILLDNAIKYSPTHTTITVKASQHKSKAFVEVIDQGIGIAPEDAPHIFKRFFRADKSRSQANGYGLGLAIAKSAIEQHRGTIHTKSSPGKGTTFLIQFPTI